MPTDNRRPCENSRDARCPWGSIRLLAPAKGVVVGVPVAWTGIGALRCLAIDATPAGLARKAPQMQAFETRRVFATQPNDSTARPRRAALGRHARMALQRSAGPRSRVRSPRLLMNAPERAPIRLTQFSHGGGCGCKIAPGVLQKLLGDIDRARVPGALLVGIETADDAAVYRLNRSQAIVATRSESGV